MDRSHPQALSIIQTLAQAGYVAYYAGGWVRDFLLGHPSDDIDIATNAPPETIQALFPKTIPIGLSFGILLVVIEGHEFEVATFRNDLEYQDGRRPSKIEFTNAVEDAKRRDFTINGMFYDPLQETVLDFVGGREDLGKKMIRAIGNPHQRIREDRLRMVRAIRLMCKLGFTIEPATQQAIRNHAQELFPAVAIERVVQELEKGKQYAKLGKMLVELHRYGLLPVIFPKLENVLLEEIESRTEPLPRFPPEAPLIAFLLPLFPPLSLQDQLALCQRLKLSNQELQWVRFFSHAQELRSKKALVERADWAHLYANPLWPVVLQVFAANQQGEEKGHLEREKELAPFIARIRNRDPLVRAEDLIRLGVKPEKRMGELLAEAERLSINGGLLDKEQVIQRLKI